jgi:hypothetical protein
MGVIAHKTINFSKELDSLHNLQVNADKLEITSQFQIYKLNNSVYLIDQVNFSLLKQKFNNNFFNCIVSLLDKGRKFIPCYFGNNFYFLSNIFDYFNVFLTKLNSKLFFTNINNNEINSTYLYLTEDLFLYNNKKTNNNINLDQDSNLIIDDDIINDILKSLIPKYRNLLCLKQYPLQKDIVNLEFEIFKNYYKIKFDYDLNNITKDEYISIKQFIKYKPFKIVECDKNIGCSIIDNNIYNDLCLEHLNNEEYFCKIEDNPLETCILNINIVLSELKSSFNINKNIYNSSYISFDLKNKYSLGKFRILTKLHKTKFGTRPIVNCKNHPTMFLAEILHNLLEPFVKKSNSFLKDSQYLINILNNMKIEDELDIHTLDIENLYMNMVLEDVLFKITDFMKNKIDSNYVTIIGFNKILNLILQNNYISFNKKFYKQIKGVAMGSISSPTIANLYLSILEDNFLVIHRPFLYKRYLDDIFIIVKKNFNINILNMYFENLKLILSSSNVVNFLDLIIEIDYTYKRFKISLYIKPTQSFAFLSMDSNHPKFIFKNIPFSILIRVRKNCSDLNDFFYYSNKYYINFKKRGYDTKKLIKTCNTIARLDRKELLKYKKRNNYYKQNYLLSNIYFDQNIYNFQDLLKNSFNNIKKENSLLNNYFLKNVNIMQPNLGAMLIHNIYSFNFHLKNLKYNKCNNINCNVCKFSTNSNLIKFTNNLKFPLSCSSSCDSSNIIYFIKCKKCNYFYIGESSRTVKDRLNEHLNYIKKFIPYTKYFKSTSIHFNLKGHNLSDFSFYIFARDLTNDTYRFHLEAKLIYIMKNIFNVNLMNNKFPSVLNNIYDIMI